MPSHKILFQLSGSIAAFKACAVISKLVQAGHEVQTLATAAALRFVGAPTLEGLSGRAVLSDVFESGQAMQHIHAIRWADLAILCPASANSINKLASGIGDDLVSTSFLAHDFRKPYLVAPAMNSTMYAHPATRKSIATLRGWGVQILESASGVLACGETGWGRLLEPDALFREVLGALDAQAPTTRPLKVLVTSGGTREAIDSVRFIANASTGRTGAAIAEHLASRGHAVTLLHARGSHEASDARLDRRRGFLTFDDLDRALREELASGACDAVVHAAAVGDYSVEWVENAAGARLPHRAGKAPSGSPLLLRLTPNPKLLVRLRDYADDRGLVVVAFKLTSNATESERTDAVSLLAREASPDFIVQNDLSEVTDAEHVASYFDGSRTLLRSCRTKAELAEAIERSLVDLVLKRKETPA